MGWGLLYRILFTCDNISSFTYFVEKIIKICEPNFVENILPKNHEKILCATP